MSEQIDTGELRREAYSHEWGTDILFVGRVVQAADELDALRAKVAKLTTERDALRELVERLPKSKDGVPVIADGKTVLYCPAGHANKLPPGSCRVYCTHGECWDDGCQGDSGSGSVWTYSQCTAKGTDHA